MSSNMSPQSTPSTVELILSASWMLTMDATQPLLTDHALVIDQGRIIDRLPLAQARQQYSAKTTTDLQQHLLMPGLINAHGHAAMSLLRGYADDLPLMQWLEQHIWPAEGQHVDADFVYQGTQLAIAEMLRSGTTCFSDMYLFPNQSARAAEAAGMRAHIAFPVFNLPTAWASSADEYISRGLELGDQYRSHSTIEIAFGPHAPYTNDDATLQRIAMLADEIDANIQMHVHETAAEVEQAVAASGERPIARLNRLGLLSPRLQAVHCTQLNATDLEQLSAAQAHVIHCPESNLKLASGICPSAHLLEHSINVALGTDGAASNNDLDLFAEMCTAALIAKGWGGDARLLNTQQALEMATINGARALGINARVGSLECGKQADVIALNLDRPEAQPVHNLNSLLCYSNSSSWVEHVWVDGKQLLKNRELCTLDEAHIINQSRQWQQKLKA